MRHNLAVKLAIVFGADHGYPFPFGRCNLPGHFRVFYKCVTFNVAFDPGALKHGRLPHGCVWCCPRVRS